MAKKTPKNEANTSKKMNSELEVPVISADDKAAPQKKSKKTAKSKSDKPNIFKRMWKGIKGVWSELKKVTWPGGKDVVKNTAVVLTVVVAFFLVLLIIDYVLSGIFGLIVSGEWTYMFIK